jgi:signal transduction histidine kinase/ligand-binding sensor domain-containing protein/CheY-like chemotaxis protein
MRKGIFILHFILAFLYCNEGWAQDNVDIHKQLNFRHITIDDGLSYNRVNSICEDHYGYIWIATYYGLNRYDGIEMQNYFYDQRDSLSLLSDIVWKVFCDSRGIIWVGTKDGLCYYNEVDNNFNKFKLEGLTPESDDIFDIYEDENRVLWFATMLGLYKYHPDSNRILRYHRKSHELGWVMPLDTVMRIMKDNRKNLWLSLYNNGLYWINPHTNASKHFVNIPGKNNSLSNNRVESIFQDGHGDIWVGTLEGGVNKLNVSDSTFSRYTIDKNNSYSNRVRVIFEDPHGNLYFGTRAGVYLYDRETGKCLPYANASHKFSTLSANSIICCYIDKKEGLWLGTLYGGANYSNFSYRPFVSFYAKENDVNYLNNPNVFDIKRDSKGKLFIATENGVNILANNGSNFDYLMNIPGNSNSLSYNDVKSIAIDRGNNLWIGTNNGGLNYYNQKTGKFTVYKNNPTDKTSIASNKIYFVFVDHADNLWALSNDNWGASPSHLSFKKSNENTFQNYYCDFYENIIETDPGNIWVGGVHGIWKIRYPSGRFTNYSSNKIFNVMALHQDRFGCIWLGSESGLARFDTATGKFLHFTILGGYPIHIVYGILSDKNDNLWISTNNGLIKFINAVVNPYKARLRVYNKDDGLPSKEFLYNSFYEDERGEMFFGTNNGLVRFFPDQIRENIFKPNIVISDLIIGDETLVPGMKINNRVILHQPVQKTKSLTMGHKVKVFTLKFHALHYVNPEKNSYRYMLEGFDHNWKYANAYNNHVTYTSLPKGSYTFRVFAANNDGIYSDQPATLHIRILPSFWQTWIFRISFIFLLITGGFLFFKKRLQNIERQKSLLEGLVAERTAALEKSYRELREQEYEILTQNEEIQSQNEELIQTHEYIEKNNVLLEAANSNLQMLNEFGREVTATHSKEDIVQLIYKYLKSVGAINIFGLGFYDSDKQGIVFSEFADEGNKIMEFISSMNDENSMGVYAFKNNETIVCNDFENEYQNYISQIKVRTIKVPKSLIYVPLVAGNKKIGVFTIQSYSRNAFSDQVVQLVGSMASIIAIGVDNANNWEIVKSQKEILEKKKDFLEHLVRERTLDLEKAKNKAEESDRLKSAFLANMSHEIRTPLNGIIGFIELLNTSETTPEERYSYHQIIKSCGYALLQLINDIIDFSKMEAGQMEFFISEINLGSFLSDIQLTFSNEVRKIQDFDRQNLQVILTNPCDRNFVIKVDSVRLQQIFNNLIGNAVKFTHEGSVEFGIKEVIPEKEIIFFVKDTGIGIDKKYQKKIFNRFVKIDDDKSTLYRGTGLGLTITKHLVEAMGGAIWLESEPGRGSEFYFTLPVSTGTCEMFKGKSDFLVPEGIPNWGDKCFLIVEDEESNYLVLDSLLKKTGVKNVWAKDGEKAVTIYNENINRFDVVLMDIKLPRMDGFQALEEIRKINPDAMVIAQTAYAFSEEEHRIFKAGFNDCIVKPITMQNLVTTISKAL